MPNPNFKSEDDKFFQLLAYAAMLEAVDEESTAKVQLLYLGVPVTHELAVTPVNLSIAKGTIVESREGIDASIAAGEFPCNVTKLCEWCDFREWCPAHGGDIGNAKPEASVRVQLRRRQVGLPESS